MFPITPWTILMNATLDGDEPGRKALEKLCRTYRDPVVSFLRIRGYNQHEAEDATQSLFLKLLQNRIWKKADPSRGKFRSFLLTILQRLIATEAERARCQKNGGGAEHIAWDESADAMAAAAVSEPEPCPDFDYQWALRTLRAALTRVEARWVERGREKQFAVLRKFLPGTQRVPSYAEVAPELGVTEENARAAVCRLRDELSEALRDEVKATVSSEAELKAEMAYLLRILASPRTAL